ncbi:MAG: ABC transporter substrate-binding protein [Candidatus Epulonipiscioides saccharophilum]|nr:MAG: ABC transporter substrate-binding protein [Epulopiscium sp. AS2M-Bin001]
MLRFLTLIVLTISLIGCGPEKLTQNQNKNQIELNVWHQWTNDNNQLKAIYDQAVKNYMDRNPQIKINTKTLSTEAYKTKIAAEFTGEAKNIDIFYYWGAGTAEKFITADKLLPLDKYISDESLADILPGSLDAFTFSDRIYALPSFSWVMSLYVNTELFEKAEVQLPSTYSELTDACQKLLELEKIIPIAIGAKDGWDSAFIYQALAMKEVGAENIKQMLDNKKEFGDDPGYLLVAKKVRDLVEMGAFGNNPLENDYDTANMLFMQGQAAMRITGSWFVNQVYTDSNSMIKPEKIAVLDIPAIKEEDSNTEYIGGFIESFWVNKNTQYKAEAAKFAIYISKQMGISSYETGTGFSAWRIEMDESKLNPLFIEVKNLLDKYEKGILAWDTVFPASIASKSNEKIQELFGSEVDPGKFIEEMKEIINK